VTKFILIAYQNDIATVIKLGKNVRHSAINRLSMQLIAFNRMDNNLSALHNVIQDHGIVRLSILLKINS
jgi:hypothetical protein